MPIRSDNVRAERAAIRSEMANIVSLAGEDGLNVKHRLALAAGRLGLSYRRARAFRAKACDAWAYEADRLRRAEGEVLVARAQKLSAELQSIKSRINASEKATNGLDKERVRPRPAVGG